MKKQTGFATVPENCKNLVNWLTRGKSYEIVDLRGKFFDVIDDSGELITASFKDDMQLDYNSWIYTPAQSVTGLA